MDETEAKRSVTQLARFLETIKRESGADKIHLLAHSMGSRVLTRAITRIEPDESLGEEPYFDLVVLGAPDIDRIVFRDDIAPRLRPRAENITIYASRNDSALQLSASLHGDLRVGEVGDQAHFFEDIDTIDVSDVCHGHSYIGDNGRVLADLRMLLTEGRCRLGARRDEHHAQAHRPHVEARATALRAGPDKISDPALISAG